MLKSKRGGESKTKAKRVSILSDVEATEASSWDQNVDWHNLTITQAEIICTQLQISKNKHAQKLGTEFMHRLDLEKERKRKRKGISDKYTAIYP